MKRMISWLVLAILGLAMLTIPVFLTFGAPAYSDMDLYFLNYGQLQAAANNIVTSVVFDYRGFDTLGESVVLFTAVIGVGLLFRKLHGGEELEDE
jgi:multisubunit Na+/H+ antiporter MnhB subunit